MSRGIGGRWIVAVLTASAVLGAGGCGVPVVVDELPGLYRNTETGGEILLDADGTFTASGLSADETMGTERADPTGAAPLTFRGQWEFRASHDETRDFVYLNVADGGIRKGVGIQLYTGERVAIGGTEVYPRGPATVEFVPDPDGPPTVVLTKVPAP